MFTRWQFPNFAMAPEVLLQYDREEQIITPTTALDSGQISAALEKLEQFHTGYDDHALKSHLLFKQKKAEGHIPKFTRFQVALPGIVNVVCGLRPEFQDVLESRYEDALVRALNRIQDSIPHPELAIQIDVAAEFAFMEGAGSFVPYFNPIFPGVIQRLSRFANNVAPDVELGFHLCYGDIRHRHFVEPKDMGLLVEVANALHKEIRRPIQWVHMPVPKGRKDLAYYKPLEKLEWKVPELYLGVVHAYDEHGTRQRMERAKEVVSEFGVATECGMGRTPTEDFGSIMEILNAVSQPVL